jgi:hypothetical protein
MNGPSFFTFVNGLIFLGVLGLAVQAFIGLGFFISSIWEKERRATVSPRCNLQVWRLF